MGILDLFDLGDFLLVFPIGWPGEYLDFSLKADLGLGILLGVLYFLSDICHGGWEADLGGLALVGDGLDLTSFWLLRSEVGEVFLLTHSSASIAWLRTLL